MPKIIYTGEDFGEFYNNDYFFIDKTRMISKIINEKRHVYSITRPRRFGKSLNLRMIREFFEKYPHPDNKIVKRNELFDGLEVSKDRKNMREFHKYPVIFLNFKSDSSNNYESAIKFIKKKISKLYKENKNKIIFEKLSEEEKIKWNEIQNGKENERNLKKSIYFLTKVLTKFYKRKSIVLIDEYDRILINGFYYNYYDNIFGIIRDMFSEALKGNDFLHIGITTGCLDVGLKNLYSGVNNSIICSFLFDTKFSDCYGFTDDELNKILLHFGISNKYKDEVRNKYDGYSCYSEKGIIKNLYNPYSIMSFVDTNKGLKDNYQFKNYWIKSGSDVILKNILYNNEFSFKKDFLSLLCGNIIIVYIKENISLDETTYMDKSKVKLEEIKNSFSKEYIWTILLYSGYITLADEEEYKQRIKEMDDQIIKLISDEPEENDYEIEENLSELEKNVNEIQLREYNKSTIEQYKNALINRNCNNDKKYVKVPNNEVLSKLTDLLTSILIKELELTKDENINNFIEGLFDKKN